MLCYENPYDINVFKSMYIFSGSKKVHNVIWIQRTSTILIHYIHFHIKKLGLYFDEGLNTR